MPSHDPHGKPATARGFCRYWDDYLHHGAPSPEALLIDPLALAQIWPQLTLREQQALHALAETGSYDAAAAAIGISRDHFSSLLSRARHHFLTLWHEHERPSGLWRRDQRTDKTGGSRRRAHKPDCACATCGQRRRRLAREHPTVATPTPVSSIELARGWPLSDLIATRRVELALGVKETARRTAQLARQHGQPCAITNSQAISRIEREHRLPKQGDLRWLALALRLPVEQVQAAAQAQTDMLQASRAARAQATLAQRIADLQDQGPLPAGWPLAEQVARRRVELGLNMVQIAQRMRQTATQDGQEVRTHDTTILQVEQRGCIPYPRTRRLLAIALELDLEQVETAAAQQHRKRQLQRASHQQTQTTTATDAAA